MAFYVVLIVLGAGAFMFNGLLLFLMFFVGDSCGVPGSSRILICDGNWYVVAFFGPWISLSVAGVVVGLGIAWARRRGRTPWPALLPGVLIHGAMLGLVYFSIWG